MSTGTDELTDDLLDDPARLPAADRAAVRAHIEGMRAAPHIGREVFQQAEAIFGGAEVSRAEFASWLQFAARVLGHDAYAEGLAAAEPGMPWRTVWAWWRPVGRYRAQPNRLMDSGMRRRVHQGRELIEVSTYGGRDVWLDLETGDHVPAPADGTTGPVPRSGDAEREFLSALALSAPEEWGESDPVPGPDGRMRYLVNDAHGVALLDTDPEVFRNWPRGEMDHSPAERGTPGRIPRSPAPTGPLSAARIDEALAPFTVRRIPEEELPAGLQHLASRAHLRDIGLPENWTCGYDGIDPHPADAMTTPDTDALRGTRLPERLKADDLLALGTSDHGKLYLHRHDGTVHIGAALQGREAKGRVLIGLAPSLDVFTRYLEGVHRYANACWYPYPDEQDIVEVFIAEMDALAPGVFDPETPSGEVWSYFYAGITELSECGY
ncbi:SUKH-4 family immunity protein [Streptomyces sp. NPDC101227]|uniref:SUKH-4 family immunity protein n=1 Tax=Streptomyces sp. NPDC101227 TaxID=3366136 RepID=UPI003809B689